MCPTNEHLFSYIRKFDNNAIQKFTNLLSYENWDDVFQGNDVNEIFNNFHNTYLRIFHTSFPIKKVYEPSKTKPWLSKGIKVSCANKRNLYITYRNSKDPNFKNCYKRYCRILSSTIAATKKRYFNDLILKSTNTLKTTWNIVRTATNKQTATNNATTINASNTPVTNPVTIADAFNDYFSSVAEYLVKNLPRKYNIADTGPLT